MKAPLALCLLLLAAAAHAALESVAWGVDPAAPLYVGQPYDLTLTFVTDEDEEIPAFTITQGPTRNPDAQTRETRDGKRRTVFRWRLAEATPRLAAIPAGRVAVQVLRVQSFGIGRTVAQGGTQTADLPAFSYDVVPLPPEAEGAPLGDFALALTADAPTFAPGDVRVLTATLTARAGLLPEAPALALEPADGVRAWPFQVVSRTPDRLVARACVALEGEAPVTLRLRPLRAFDLTARALRDVPCPPLALTPRDEPAEAGPTPLRLAPGEHAAVLGALGDAPPEPTGERVPGWVRVRAGGLTGWVPEAALKGTAP